MPHTYDKCFDSLELDNMDMLINEEDRAGVYIQASLFGKSSVSIETVYSTYIMTVVTTVGSIVCPAIDDQRYIPSTLKKFITLLSDSRFVVYDSPFTLRVCADNISVFFEKFPVVTTNFLAELITQRFAGYELYNAEDTIYQIEMFEEIISNEPMLAAWYSSYFATLRSKCNNYDVNLTYNQLLNKILLFSMNHPNEQNSFIHKAAAKMNVTFLMFLISCRHDASFNSNVFIRQMQQACVNMLQNIDFEEEYKAQRITEFLYKMQGAFGHIKGFRKNLSIFLKNEIKKYCSKNNSFAYFMGNKPTLLFINRSWNNITVNQQPLIEQQEPERRQPDSDPRLHEELLVYQQRRSNAQRAIYS